MHYSISKLKIPQGPVQYFNKIVLLSVMIHRKTLSLLWSHICGIWSNFSCYYVVCPVGGNRALYPLQGVKHETKLKGQSQTSTSCISHKSYYSLSPFLFVLLVFIWPVSGTPQRDCCALCLTERHKKAPLGSKWSKCSVTWEDHTPIVFHF